MNVEPWPSTDQTPDLAAVGGGDVLDDREAEAGAAGGAVAGRVDAVEPLEDPVHLAGGDADALVGDGEVDHAGRRPVAATTTVEPSAE